MQVINEIYKFGLVVKNKEDIPGFEENPGTPAGTLGIVEASMKYSGDELHVRFTDWHGHIVQRTALQVVACERCSPYGYYGRPSNAEKIIRKIRKDGDSSVYEYIPVCKDCYEEWQFMELWNFLTGGELPDGVHISDWQPISKRQAASIVWLLQEHYHFMVDNWEVCDECEEPFDSHTESYQDFPGKGVLCWDCARQFGTYCEECGDFYLYEKLDDERRCAKCAADSESEEDAQVAE